MENIPPESQAFRRMVFAALIAFVIGFVGFLAALLSVLLHLASDEAGWWEIFGTLIGAIQIALVFGLLGSLLAISLFRPYRHYRCPYCDQPLKGPRILCNCSGAQSFRASLGKGELYENAV